MGGTGPGKLEAATNATTDRTKRDLQPRSAPNATYYDRWSTRTEAKSPFLSPVGMTVVKTGRLES